MNEFITAEDKMQIPPKPPISVGRITGEILVGAGMGLGIGLPVSLGSLPLMAPHIKAEDCFGIGALVAVAVAVSFVFMATYSLGSAMGVYLVGRIGKQTGSFLMTLGCSFLGGLGAIATVSCVQEIVLFLPLLLLPPTLATLGFNATRRYRGSFEKEQRGNTGLTVPNWVAALLLIAAILVLDVLLVKYLADILPWLLR